MPNYRLTHKMTGVTVPVTAGYYGLNNQSTTEWRLAGGGAYAWKSATFDDTFFIGATADSTAYDTVTISDADEAGFDGNYVYDSDLAKWIKGIYSIYKDTTWFLTDGSIVYAAADNSRTTPPATFTYVADNATLSISSTAKFISDAISGTWSAINSGIGTPVYGAYTISEAWDTAEEAVFDSLALFLGNTEDKDCFRGYIPIISDGTYKFVNVWKITSGGGSSSYGIERTYGAAGNWCNELINAEVSGVFENRSTAMHFCNSVMAWLKSNNNLNETGTINWCRLMSLPEAPEEQIIGNDRYWLVTVPLEILFLTEGIYS